MVEAWKGGMEEVTKVIHDTEKPWDPGRENYVSGVTTG